jgi:AcrR family transcriptional regulator
MTAEDAEPPPDAARGLDLLWGERKRPSRGPKPALSVEQIAQTAIGIADAEGLAALSMRRVADELGFTPMALYRYVPGKHELVEVMLDVGVGPPPESIAAAGGWRAQLERWSREIFAIYMRHRWVLDVPLAGLRMGPNRLAWLESALTALDGTGLTDSEMLAATLALDGHPRAMAQIAVAVESGQGGTDEWSPTFARMLEQVIDEEHYPTLSRFLAAGTFHEPAPSDDPGFEFGMHRLLDGIGALIESRDVENGRAAST